MPRGSTAVSYPGRPPPVGDGPPMAAGNATGRNAPVLELERAIDDLIASAASVSAQRSAVMPRALANGASGLPPQLPVSLLGAVAMAALGGLNSPTSGTRRMAMGDRNFNETVQGTASRRPQDAQVTDDEVRRFAGDDVEVIDLNQNRDRIQRTTWW